MISNQSFTTDPEVLGGAPTFTGTRVPISALIDYLSAGDTLDMFLNDFPSVHKQQAQAILTFMEHSLHHAHPY